MNLEDFLDKLENVRSAGSGYTALCPSHDDRSNSLGVAEADDRLLVKCYAGCETQQVLDALSLSFSDLFFNTVNYAEPEAVYPYTDEQGNELFQAVRFPGKNFKQRHMGDDGEWIWNLDNVRRVLYGLPEVIAAIASGQTVYFVEGEKDAERLRSLGKVATCNPMGAGKWRDEYVTMLAGAHVIIIADRDDPGRKHAETIKAALLGHALSIFVFQAKVGKDVSDHLDAGLALEQMKPMKARVRRGIITARELAEQGVEDLDFRVQDMPAYQPWESIPVELRQGRSYAIGAYTGDGKTSAALQGLRGLCTQGTRCGYFSLEMPERDLRNKLLAHVGVPLHYSEHPWKIKADPEMLERYHRGLEEIGGWGADIIFDSSITAEKILEISRDREYEVVFVDHLHRFAWGHERRKLDEQVNIMTNMALELNTTLVVLCQLRKFTRGKDMDVYPRPILQDFRETSMIGDDASMAIALWRERPDGLTYTGTTMAIVLKNRHTTGQGDKAGQIYFQNYDVERQIYLPGGVSYGSGAEHEGQAGLVEGGAEEVEAWLPS